MHVPIIFSFFCFCLFFIYYFRNEPLDPRWPRRSKKVRAKVLNDIYCTISCVVILLWVLQYVEGGRKRKLCSLSSVEIR